MNFFLLKYYLKIIFYNLNNMDNAIEDIIDFGTDDVIETFDDEPELENEQNIDVVSYDDIRKNKTPKKTVPFLNKFERSRLIGVRRQQLANGAQPKINTSGFNTINEIVDEELKQRKIPFILRRKVGSKYEYWKLEDLHY